MIKRVFAGIGLCLVLCFAANAQEATFSQRLSSLSFSNAFPENLLKTRSVVLYDISPEQTQPVIRGDWQSVAEKIQPTLKKSGIDGVVHYYLRDLFSGKESYNTFLDYYDDRDIKNAVFVKENAGNYEIIVTDLQDRQFLLKEGQAAWKQSGPNLEEILDNLYRAVANAGLDRENRLILEGPEFGQLLSPIKAKRNEFYDLNFSSEKLAIPVFEDTAAINSAMDAYPYAYGYVAEETAEKELRTQGYQYILYYVRSTGRSVKEILKYKTTSSETDYISEVVKDKKLSVESYNIHTPVYKFYIKHIYSGNVFLGKKWDAAPEWQKALNNYMLNLRNELVRN
ncbi:hypothetical protein FNH22_27225 [Fulvivirga sp. M361]|uniref:hypothetical protein n=1 Tax=Fulvivirga sp. M361 TaxID=2594266 RepID=UPI00117B0522|nr:hypothetical protein [Fulvivirga sp. M361]TRX49321.1 hypothetical protein FNH22_27225 [Fulvivirga sp. M361]